MPDTDSIVNHDIYKKACGQICNNSIITGGHFRIFFEKNGEKIVINKGTLRSFEYAAKLYIYAVTNKIKAELGVLINDMGSSCLEEGCDLSNRSFIRNNYKLPEEYNEILKQNNLDSYPVKIYWEKHIRNRGKKELLKLLRDHKYALEAKDLIFPEIIKEEDGFYFYDPAGYGKILLTRLNGKDKYGTPACPLIMAGLGMEQNKYYPCSINFYYTGEDNIQNIPNHYVIEKGKRICELTGRSININNFYFSQ